MKTLTEFQESTQNEIAFMHERIGNLEEMMEKISKIVVGSQGMINTSSHSAHDDSSFRLAEEGKSGVPKKEEGVWSKVLEYIDEERYNDVYNWVLGKKDNLLLIRLMGKTGVVIEALDSQNVEFLLSKITDLIASGEFIDLLLGWVLAAVDRKIKLSLNTQSAIVECMEQLLSEESLKLHRLEEPQIEEISSAITVLHNSLNSVTDSLQQFFINNLLINMIQ